MAMAIVSLTEADANSSRTVGLDQTVTLRLPENPSTGYRWSIEITPPNAAVVSGTRWISAGSGVGASGTREFEIITKQVGTIIIRAKLWREWQGEGSINERREFTLHVSSN
jgi:inhibitor of cysteine peptidase